MSIQITFEKEKCVGCFACHAACLEAHYEAQDTAAKSRRGNQILLDRERGFQKNICPGCIHCGRCILACEQQVFYKEKESGLVLADLKRCIGCGKCLESCPMHVLAINEETQKIQKCDGCIERLKNGREPACVRMCATGALKLK